MLFLGRGTGLKRLIAALQTDDTAILQSNITKRDSLPTLCRRGENADAFHRRSLAERERRGV
jgi:hypothetical protein